jgi:hypothetical protein
MVLDVTLLFDKIMIRRHFIINNNDNDNGDNIIIYTTLNSNIFNMSSLQQSL